MTSEDRIIIELINSRFDAFEKRFDASEKNNAERFEMINGQLVQLRKDVDSLKAEVVEIKHDVKMNSARVGDLHSFISVGFTIMAAVIALIGFMMTLAPMFRDMYRDRKQERKEHAEYVTRSEVEEIITKALRMRQAE